MYLRKINPDLFWWHQMDEQVMVMCSNEIRSWSCRFKKITTHRVARDIYKVVYDPDTLRVDIEATEKARNTERKNRKSRAKPYDDL